MRDVDESMDGETDEEGLRKGCGRNVAFIFPYAFHPDSVGRWGELIAHPSIPSFIHPWMVGSGFYLRAEHDISRELP